MRRRRRLPETYTLLQCSHCQNVAGDMTCSNPFIDVFPLISMSSPKTPSDFTEIVSPSEKYLVVDAIKFEMEYYHNPEDSDQCTQTPQQDVTLVTTFLKIWEAIMVLPIAQGTTAATPAYLPVLTDTLRQVGDNADRVLWKRISSLPMWGVNTTSLVPNLTETNRDFGHGPVVVKSKARLDDRHGLFYVRNYTHNVFWGFPPRNPGCVIDCDGDPDHPIIPVLDDAWFKIFYHTRK